MSAPRAGDAFQFVHVLGTRVAEKTKRILCQTGSNVGEGQPDASEVEHVQHVGFASRPSNNELGKDAASALVLRLGNREIAVASFDERGLPLYGNLKAGETCVYAAGADGAGQARILLKDNGSINLYTRKGNTEGGVGMMFQMDAENGAIRMINDQGYGIIIDEDGIKITSGAASLTLGADGGVSLIGTGRCVVDGSSICLGSIALPVVNSVCVGPAGLVAVASTKVYCALA